MSWDQWGVIGAWFGAIGQVATALVVLLYTMRSTKATSTKYLKDMVNNWNAFAVSTPAHRKALAEMRPPVLGQPKDAIVFSYLNYLHANFVMRAERQISADVEGNAIRNGVSWLRSLEKKTLQEFLDRGYDGPFKKRILDEYDQLPPEPPPIIETKAQV